MDLNEIRVFTQVVKQGSFSGAAKQLGMPNSTVSAKVSGLEKRLGVTLLKRTTRKLALTPAGQAFFEKSSAGLMALQAAEDEVKVAQTEPQGTLRITAPIELGSTIFSEVIKAFLAGYPRVRLEIELTNRTVDLVEEGVDLALRAGSLRDSSLVAKKLGSVYFAPFAAPTYLKAAGAPAHPRDLAGHNCLHFTPLAGTHWELLGPKGKALFPARSTVAANDLNMLKALTMEGLGIALLPTFLCAGECDRGKLVRILPAWKSQETQVHFVYPAQRFVPAPLKAFLEVGAGLIREKLHAFRL